MPSIDDAILMARYNHWQNESLVAAASTLSPSERQMERGAFFGSIEKTFSHLLWGDTTWLSRFTGSPLPQGGIPQSTDLITNWDTFCGERTALDRSILAWAHALTSEWMVGDISWFSGALGRDVSKPKQTLVLHFFNHQTHHRGQIHAMLTSAGAQPGATDLPFMPETFGQL